MPTLQGRRSSGDVTAKKRYQIADFVQGPWFALVSVLAVVVLIVLVLRNRFTDPVAALTGLAGVLVALAGFVAAATRYRR